MITVKQLIDHLKQFDEDLPVIGSHDTWTWWKELEEIKTVMYTDDGQYINIHDAHLQTHKLKKQAIVI